MTTLTMAQRIHNEWKRSLNVKVPNGTITSETGAYEYTRLYYPKSIQYVSAQYRHALRLCQ